MLLHAPNQRYKRLKIKNGQNDCSGNSIVNHCFQQDSKVLHILLVITMKQDVIEKTAIY